MQNTALASFTVALGGIAGVIAVVAYLISPTIRKYCLSENLSD
ncbi:MAG: hypothetical protein R3C14_21560 [Caldilineaceae bacterium]